MARHLYELALCAAFWVALWRFDGTHLSGARFVAGLALGALLASQGGLLCVPIGLLLAAPLAAAARARFLDAALPTLPCGFAAAKLGCLAAGCCAAAGVEALGFAALGASLRLVPHRYGPTLALAGIGVVRLLALPLRPGARGSALLTIVWLALAALRCRPKQRDEPCPRPGNETSSKTR